MNTASHNSNARRSTLIGAFLLSLTMFFGMQGCSSSSDAPVVIAPTDSVPVGYFTGTALLDTGPTDVQDMVGMVYGNRLMVFSMTENVLFDITMDITLDDFTGAVDAYLDGVKQGLTITVDGTTTNSRIQGTFTGGSGRSTGSFDILLETINNDAATLERADSTITSDFSGELRGIITGTGIVNNSATGAYSIADITANRCLSRGQLVIPDLNANIYQLAHDIVEQISFPGDCTAPALSSNHTGFASVTSSLGGNSDDTFVFAFANDSVALFSSVLIR